MVPEIGLFALVLALALAAVQSVAPLVGAHRNQPALMALGRAAAAMSPGFVTLAFLCLMLSFATMDFSVANVASNSHTTQPLAYRLAATWGSHEGSMLLWVLILSLCAGAVATYGQNLRETLQARVIGVQGLLLVAFLGFLILTSNPFARLSPAPVEGVELNPLLQDPGLIFHPPLLYIGYVGFSVAFAFACAALIEGRVDAAWARWVRPWVLAAWVALTAGITLGSWWAYYELGWGGWWFWDPVENASFMPWLLGTALLHSALVLERRGALISWTLLLAILTFTLSLIGTFLVRSGLLTSVHAFAVDPARGSYILAIIGVFTGAALALYAWRAPAMRTGALFTPVSREGGITLNNLFLVVACATVFLGTFYPVFVDALNGGKISVGPPYYNLTFTPLMVPLLVLVVFGPMLQWKRDGVRAAARRLRWPALAAGVVLVGSVLAFGVGRVLTAGGLALGAWLVLGSFTILAKRWKLFERGAEGRWTKLRTTPPAVWGMVLAHAGLGVLTLGVTGVTSFESRAVGTLAVGERLVVGGVPVVLERLGPAEGPNYAAERAEFRVGRRLLVSEKRLYTSSGTTTTEAGIGSGLLVNTYVALGERSADGRRVVVRAWRHPLVGWIWGGAMLMSLGGMVSLSDRRLRWGAATRAAPAAVTAAPPLPDRGGAPVPVPA